MGAAKMKLRERNIGLKPKKFTDGRASLREKRKKKRKMRKDK